MTAAENGAKVRVIVYPKPVEGIENTLAVEILWNYLQTRDLGDRFEVRLYEDPMHVKAVLVDDEFLIIGSQNFHYSAFGDGAGLTEYSLGTDDPEAIQEFKRYFDYYWESAIPLEF
jgi:cardiolipin synthase